MYTILRRFDCFLGGNFCKKFWGFFVEERKKNDRSFSQGQGMERVPFFKIGTKNEARNKEQGTERIQKIGGTAKALVKNL